MVALPVLPDDLLHSLIELGLVFVLDAVAGDGGRWKAARLVRTGQA
jgi:hypothetical protein